MRPDRGRLPEVEIRELLAGDGEQLAALFAAAPVNLFEAGSFGNQ
jgi:hypothetical protein